jgi:uncharacterized protein (DUF433 family)
MLNIDDRNMNGYAIHANPLERITVEPGKRSGQACIRGLRITVKDVLEYLASGMSQEDILAAFPYLELADFQAIYAYAAQQIPGT